jgi:hypothetical protein
VLGALSDENFEAMVVVTRDKVARAVRTAVREVEMKQQKRDSYSLETPRVMLPSPTGRKMRVIRNPTEQRWMLVIGPSVSRATLQEKEEAARESATVQQMQMRQWALQNKALELEDELKDLRQRAKDIEREIEHEIKNIVGPASPFTETYEFRCDEATDAELAALPQRARASARRSAARGERHGRRGARRDRARLLGRYGGHVRSTDRPRPWSLDQDGLAGMVGRVWLERRRRRGRAMSRERLPNRRRCESFSVKCANLAYTATIARFSDGRLAEIFLTNHKQGSHADASARDSAVVCSIALQYGVPLEVIRGALLRDSEGRASTPLGAALDEIAAQEGKR